MEHGVRTVVTNPAWSLALAKIETVVRKMVQRHLACNNNGSKRCQRISLALPVKRRCTRLLSRRVTNHWCARINKKRSAEVKTHPVRCHS